MQRRQFLKSSGQAGTGLLLAPFVNRNRYRIFPDFQVEYSSHTIELVGRSTVIDMLGILTLGRSSWLRDPDTFKLSDWQRFKDSSINVFHMADGFVGSASQAFDWRLQQAAVWNSFIANHDEWLMRVDSADDLQRVKARGRSAFCSVRRTQLTFARQPMLIASTAWARVCRG